MADLIGRFLKGRYRVDQLIGQGGMAEVYKAWDTQRAAPVALKLLRTDLAQDATFWEHFRAEADTLERLDHPHIVRFYGLEQEGDLTFIVLDYIEGNSLKAEINQKRHRGLSPQRVLDIMRPICSALHFAHQQGMVHCDVKPGNILINAAGQVYLADFGIVWMMGSSSHSAGPTGTATHMAPEQIRSERPTPQTDIYGLGVILYEMLTGGELPFNGDQAAIAGGLRDKIYWEHLNLKPPPVRRNHPYISKGFEAIIMRCLEKSPRYRYRNVMELLDAITLELANAGRVTSDRPGSKPNQGQTERLDIGSAGKAQALPIEHPHPKRIPGWLVVVLASIVVVVMVIAIGTGGGDGDQTYTPPTVQKPASPVSGPQTYPIDACMEIPVGSGKMTECVVEVNIQSNGSMQVIFSWKAETASLMEIIKKPPDTGNINFYLTDNQGRRYDHYQTGGAANELVDMHNGQMVIGWFVFPAAAPDARSFIFHDDDNLVQTPQFYRNWP